MREKRGTAGKRLWILAAALLAASVLLYVLVLRPSAGGTPETQTVQVLLDGEALGNEKSIHPGGEDLRVYITLN
ncbi:MAG: hypothetical protein ABS897_07105, partial [Eubacteriales bacterium]